MKKVAFILICLLFCCTMVSAQEKSELQKQAEAIAPGQNNAQAGRIPHLAPVVSTQGVRSEPIGAVRADEGQLGVIVEGVDVKLADHRRNEREDEEQHEDDEHHDGALLFQEVLPHALPVTVLAVAGALSFLIVVLCRGKQLLFRHGGTPVDIRTTFFIGVFRRIHGCLFHFSHDDITGVILGINALQDDFLFVVHISACLPFWSD